MKLASVVYFLVQKRFASLNCRLFDDKRVARRIGLAARVKMRTKEYFHIIHVQM